MDDDDPYAAATGQPRPRGGVDWGLGCFAFVLGFALGALAAGLVLYWAITWSIRYGEEHPAVPTTVQGPRAR